MTIEKFGEKIELDYCSSSHNPDQNPEVVTDDLVLWVKFKFRWYKPYSYNNDTIIDGIDKCKSPHELKDYLESIS